MFDVALDVEVRQHPVEGLGQRPVGLSDDQHQAGTRIERTIRASSRTATARPRPNISMMHLAAEDERAEDEDHDRGGGGDRPTGRREAAGDREPVVAGSCATPRRCG